VLACLVFSMPKGTNSFTISRLSAKRPSSIRNRTLKFGFTQKENLAVGIFFSLVISGIGRNWGNQVP
jgi:hypothetical protein